MEETSRMRTTQNSRLDFNLELERVVDYEGDVGTLSIKASLIQDRTSMVSIGVFGTKSSTDWYRLDELDEGTFTIVTNDNSILHAETYQDAVSIFLARIELDLMQKIQDTLVVEGPNE